MTELRYRRLGWGTSLGAHLLLLLIFLALRLELPPFVLDFTPVDFAPLSDLTEEAMSALSALESNAPVVELPRRPMLDETSPLLMAPDRARPPALGRLPIERPEEARPDLTLSGRRLLLPTDVVGRRDRPVTAPLPVASSWLEGERRQALSAKLAGDEMFSISWEGPAREKTSGDLPEFPPGVEAAATVRLTFDVAPDGSVLFAAPITKGVAELEKVSLDALRTWRFNALDPAQPQVKQRGEITFIFTLR